MNDEPPLFSVPRVATRRLLLREFRLTDFDAYAENWADPLATEHLSGVADRRMAWRNFNAGTGQWLLNGGGWWGVELVGAGHLVGTVGAFFRESARDLEIGWTMYRSFWRQGFASEAAAAALAWGFDAHPVNRAVAHVSRANLASVRVAEKIGMRDVGDVDFYGEPIARYAIDRPGA